MTGDTPAPAAPRREDVLVSVCLADGAPDSAQLRALTERIDGRYRFWEVIVVTGSGEMDASRDLVESIPNLRLIGVRDDTVYYRRRIAAADEAIGDLVLMVASDELPYVDHLAMLKMAEDRGSIVRTLRDLRGMAAASSVVFAWLGRGARFDVGLDRLQTTVVPRTLLNRLLSHADAELALRFPPRNAGLRIVDLPAEPGASGMRLGGGLRRRVWLLQRLLVNLAPALLVYVAVSAALLMTMGGGYALYALAVWALLPELEPGWLTISLMLSLTACFLGFSILGLSMGLQQILRQNRPNARDDVVEELSRADIFGEVVRDLNVEVDRGAPEPPFHPAEVDAPLGTRV